MSQMGRSPLMPPPVPNRWKSAGHRPVWIALAIIGLLGLIIGAAWIWTHHPDGSPSSSPTSPPVVSTSTLRVVEQPHALLEVTTSTGGHQETHGKADPSTISLEGDKIAAEDLKLTATVMSFDGLGAITGGGFGGSFKVSASMGHLLQVLSALFGVACLVSGVWKLKSPIPDYVHGAGMIATGLGFILGAIFPELLGWFGFGAAVVAVVSHWFPSLSAKVGAESKITLRKFSDRLAIIDPTVHAKTVAALPDASKLILAKAAAKVGP